jgi:FkbM family methyltransferase
MPPHRLRDVLAFESMLRYSVWRLARDTRPLTVRLRSGLRFTMRPPPARDLTTAHDIFVSEIYEPAPDAIAAREPLIVDTGANVGYSTLYFAHRFPHSRILAFEPHPVFADLFERNVLLNGLTSRVTLVRAAADAGGGTGQLTDAEDCSTLVDRTGNDTIAIRTIDFFAALHALPVALLKMDIEGGEAVLLADPRFETLDVAVLLLEWHDAAGHGQIKRQYVERLTALGYDVSTGRQDGQATGLLTAIHPLRIGRHQPPRR